MQVNRRGFHRRLGRRHPRSDVRRPGLRAGRRHVKYAGAARGLRTIDPHKSIQGVDNWAIIALYDKLVDLPRWQFPATLDELVPRLATSWTSSEDAKTWTFQLREGVQFHKGYGEMTSEDVKFTFDRATDAVRVGGVRAKFTNIESVETDGPYTVVFHLTQPDPLFPLGVLSDYDGAVMSKKAIEEKGEEAIGTDPIGTGVYVLETVHTDPSQGVTLVANDDYWDTPAVTPKLQILYIADTTARTLAILSGDVHMIEGVRAPGWADSMKQRDSSLIFDVVSPGSFFTMQFNLTVKPFDDIRVRQALFYAHRPRRDHHRDRADQQADLRAEPAVLPGRLHRRDHPGRGRLQLRSGEGEGAAGGGGLPGRLQLPEHHLAARGLLGDHADDPGPAAPGRRSTCSSRSRTTPRSTPTRTSARTPCSSSPRRCRRSRPR